MVCISKIDPRAEGTYLWVSLAIWMVHRPTCLTDWFTTI